MVSDKKLEKLKRKVLASGTWSSAVAFNAQETAYTVRKVLDRLGYVYERETEQKHYQKFIAGFVPVPQFAYVFEFVVSEPSSFVIKLYDTKPTQSGVLHMLDIEGVTEDNFDDIGAMLKGLVRDLPRKPWEFFWSERFRYALFASEYLKARKMWLIFGIK